MRTKLAAVVAVTLAAAGLSLVGPAAQAAPTTRIYEGTGTGAVPDAPGCDVVGDPLEVTFEVSGAPVGGLTDVRIQRLVMASPYIGDITAVLIAPDGTTSTTVFGRTGKVQAVSSDTSPAEGPYEFSDDADAGDWWAAAAAATGSTKVAAGNYRASTPGGPLAPPSEAGVATSLTDAFAGVTDANGTWTLAFDDRCNGDITTISRVQLGLRIAPGCATATARVATAQARVTEVEGDAATAAAGLTQAQADRTAATATLTEAQQKVTAAKKALKKAKKNAKKKGKKGKSAVAKAKKRLRSATAVVPLAKAGVKLATAGVTLATAATSAVDARLDDAEDTLAAATEALGDCQAS